MEKFKGTLIYLVARGCRQSYKEAVEIVEYSRIFTKDTTVSLVKND